MTVWDVLPGDLAAAIAVVRERGGLAQMPTDEQVVLARLMSGQLLEYRDALRAAGLD